MCTVLIPILIIDLSAYPRKSGYNLPLNSNTDRCLPRYVRVGVHTSDSKSIHPLTSGQVKHHFRKWTLFSILLLFAAVNTTVAQQARGLFFSVFGESAPPERGDFNHAQVIYLELPESETRPVYLRIFDAEVGGYLDERHGRFNTRTRFLLLGGDSAGRIYGAQPVIRRSPYVDHQFPESDIIHDRTFGTEPRYDGRYYVLGELPLERGFETIDGYRRFAFLVLGIEGDDGNFFDFVLSYDPNDKIEPETYRMFAYDITLRIPNERSFEGQIRIPVEGRNQLQVATFGLNNEPAIVKIPFQEDIPLRSSPAGQWVTNTISIADPELTESIGFNFYGSNVNNTFSFLVLDENGGPVAIPLPILDYEPVETPFFRIETAYAPDNCKDVTLEKIIINGENFLNPAAVWSFGTDTLEGSRVRREFDRPGFHPFNVAITGMMQGTAQTVIIHDSVRVNEPPLAWAGGNRSFVAGRPMAFDGTVSEASFGSIIRYEWDFGDGNTGVGARVDHTYTEPGEYTVTLRVTDDSGTACNQASASATVRVNLPPVARINAPVSAQFGETVILDGSASTDPDGEIVEYRWEIFGEVVSSDSITAYTIQLDRNVPVTLHVTDDAFTMNSTSSASHTIRINQRPIANAGADKHVSPNRPATFNANRSRDPDGSIVHYEWLFPDDIVREGMTVQQGIAEPGDHFVYLRVTDNEGAIGVDSLYVRVNFPPVPVITGDLVSSDGAVMLSAADSYDPDGEIISYEWHLGDGRRVVGPVAEHTYRRPGSYDIRLTIVDDSGTFSSVQTARAVVLVNQLPVARLNAPSVGAPGLPVRFDGSASSDPDGSISRHTWDFGDGNTAEGPVALHSFEEPGIYQVQLTVYDDTGLPQATGFATTEVNIKPAPVLTASAPARVAPGTAFEVDLSESHSPGSQIRNWYWFMDGRWQSGQSSRSFTMGDSGRIDIRFAAENDSGLPNSRSEGTVSVLVNHSPQVAAIPPVVANDPTVYFDMSASSDRDGDALRFFWEFGDGTEAEGPVVTHTYAEPGEYSVRLIVDDQQGLANSKITRLTQVTITTEPQIAMDLPELLCAGRAFSYRATGDAPVTGSTIRFSWDFGDGFTSNTPAGTHTIREPGRYMVTLTADDALGLPNSRTERVQFVDVAGKPVAVAGPDVTTCATESVLFDASASYGRGSEIVRYLWDFGDGTSAEGATVAHRYAVPGVYTARLTVECAAVSDCDFSAVDQRTITVLPSAVARFTLPEALAEGDTLLLNPSESIVDGHQVRLIRWELGNGENIIWELSQPGTPAARWERRAGRRGAAEQIAVAELRGSLPVSRIAPERGIQTIRLHIETITAAGCNTASMERTVEVRPQVSLQIARVPVLTPGQRHRFRMNAGSNDLRYLAEPVWFFGDTQIPGREAFFGWPNPGTYVVRITDATLGNPSSASPSGILDEIRVRVNAPPVPVIDGPSLVTRGETVRFDGQASHDPDGQITRYRWISGSGAESDSSSITLTFNQTGWYTLTLLVEDNDALTNSRRSVTREIQVVDPVSLQSSLPPLVCTDEVLNLPRLLGLNVARFAELSISMNGQTLDYAGASVLRVSEAGSKTIAVSTTDGVQILAETISFISAPAISAQIPPSATLGRIDDAVLFDASETVAQNGPGVRIYWDFGDGSTAAGQRVRHTYRRPGNYTVTLRAVVPGELPCSSSTETYRITINRN
jgi:large repetitive protein